MYNHLSREGFGLIKKVKSSIITTKASKYNLELMFRHPDDLNGVKSLTISATRLLDIKSVRTNFELTAGGIR